MSHEPLDRHAVEQLLREYIRGRGTHSTRVTYRDSLKKFAQFLAKASRWDAAEYLLRASGPEANAKARQYRAFLEGKGLRPATVDAELSAVRGFTRWAQERGLIDWCISFAQNGKPRLALRDLVRKYGAPSLAESDDRALAEARRLLGLYGMAHPNENTRRAYRQALLHLAVFLKVSSPEEALSKLLHAGRGGSSALALEYLGWMQQAGCASSTMAARIAALRSLLKLAREVGIIEWEFSVRGPKVEYVLDTRGPGAEKIGAVLRSLALRKDPPGRRDHALIWLLYGLGLRASEVVGLDLEHVDFSKGRVSILGKARKAREWLTVPEQAMTALRGWMVARGVEPGPLFTGMRDGGRLRRESLWRVTTRYGLGRPHGLRHSAITRALDLTNGDVRRVRLFSRHRNLNTLIVYDDLRQDVGGTLAQAVASDVDPGKRQDGPRKMVSP